jgi:hypothetical protein
VVVVPVAVASAVLAALADASPTGFGGTDLAAKAALGAVMVLAATRIGLWTCLASAGLGVVASGGSSEAAAATAGGVGLLLAALAAGERRPVPALHALAGAGVAQGALRLEWPEPTGSSALAALVILAPVLIAGLRQAPVGVRRGVGRGVAVYAAFSVVAGAAALLGALGARTTVDDGVRAAREGLAAVERSDQEGAARAFDVAATAFRKADGSIGAWWARPALVVPVVGHHAEALRALASSGADLAGVGARAAREADPDSLRLAGGQIDLDALAAVRRPLESAMASLERSEASLEAADSPWLVAPVADRVEELRDKVLSASTSTRTAVSALRLAPGLLGADGPRRYFLAIQTPAEARAAGGLMGNFGELVADRGRIQLGRFGRVQELNLGGGGQARTISGPPDYVRRYSPFMPDKYWQTVTMSPDFPSVAQVMEELYPQSGGVEVDGVISVDPYAFAGFLKLVGSITLPGRPEINAENATKLLLHDTYVEFGEAGEVDRVDFIGTVARTLFTRLTTTTLPSPRAIADALSPVVAGRHLQLASVRPAEQRFFEDIGADGGVPPVQGDFLGVVSQNYNGNKIDWFLRRSYRYEVEYRPRSGTVRSRLEVSLRNEAPASGLPPAVIGFGGFAGPGQPVSENGENIQLVSVYSPLSLERMTVNGQAVEASAENELGRRVYSALVRVPSGATRTVELELSGRIDPDHGHDYRLDVLRQATVVPDEVSVEVSFGTGWEARRAEGFTAVGPGTAAAEAVAVDRNRVFAARLEPRVDSLLDHLRQGR